MRYFVQFDNGMTLESDDICFTQTLKETMAHHPDMDEMDMACKIIDQLEATSNNLANGVADIESFHFQVNGRNVYIHTGKIAWIEVIGAEEFIKSMHTYAEAKDALADA